MSGDSLPPPSPFAPPTSGPVPNVPNPSSGDATRSPWDRPLPGTPTVEFDVQPNEPPAPPLTAAASRPWKLVGALAVTAMLVAAGALFAMRGGDEAAGANQASGTTPPTTPATITTPTDALPSTVPANTTAETMPETTIPVETTPATAPPTTAATTIATTIAAPPTETVPPSTIGPVDVAPGTYSLDAVPDRAPEGQRFTMEFSSMSVTGEIDADQRFRMQMDLGNGTTTEIVYDVRGGVGYLRGEAFAGLSDTGATWLGIDLEQMAEAAGVPYEQFLDSFNATPDIAAIGGLVAPSPLGLTEIDGETLMLYTLTLDTADLAAIDSTLSANPVYGNLTAFATGITYRFYVNEANALRRLEMDIDVDGATETIVMTMLSVEPDFAVALPDPADVEMIDLDDLS